MNADRAARRWDPGRNETQTERLDRHWATLLQELRVAQTGVTLLAGSITLAAAAGPWFAIPLRKRRPRG